MFTHKDIEYRSIFVINCIDNKALRVSSGELLLEDSTNNKTLTKLPFQKILALFIIGHISITTPLIEKCKRYNVALVVMKPSLRPVFFWHNSAEANFLLRKRQYEYDINDISIAKIIVENKIQNQLKLLENTRSKNDAIFSAKSACAIAFDTISDITNYKDLLGIEGYVAKNFFLAYFEKQSWKGRKPRIKCDSLNATLDIGYTILFNFVEVFARMFGFDIFIGIYHRLWFKRKSLICDLMEPFRCIIDSQVRKSFNNKQFKDDDFNIIKNEYILKPDMNKVYCKIFYDALVLRKSDFFIYVQSYYRCFMQNKTSDFYPSFKY